MKDHYCHNCRHHSLLIDGVYCESCLSFFYAHSRMPMAGETTVTRVASPNDPWPTINRLFASLGKVST